MRGAVQCAVCSVQRHHVGVSLCCVCVRRGGGCRQGTGVRAQASQTVMSSGITYINTEQLTEIGEPITTDRSRRNSLISANCPSQTRPAGSRLRGCYVFKTCEVCYQATGNHGLIARGRTCPFTKLQPLKEIICLREKYRH